MAINRTRLTLIETDIYRLRFSADELTQQRAFWAPICRYIEQFIDKQGTTLDLGAGYCHFINNVRSLNKFALDLNEENLRIHADKGVTKLVSTGASINLPNRSLDTVFASNVYEHFPSREDVASSFAEVYRTLKPGGRFVIMQPNFAYCQKEYFDFFDHRLAFTHRAMTEGLQIAGFDLKKIVPQFLPYTSKSKLPRAPWLVELYLRVPLAWKLLGGQMLLVAEKARTAGLAAIK